MGKVNILLAYHMDPLGKRIGGIETFIKNYIIHAPDDFNIDFVGVTSDTINRPVGSWQTLSLSGRTFRFLPILSVEDENIISKIPLSIKYTFALKAHGRKIETERRILVFNRIEPAFAFIRNTNPCFLFNHGNMLDFNNPYCEVRWSGFPWLYFMLEKILIKKMNKVYIVREDGVDFYQNKYPEIKERFSFLPTMVDSGIFYPWNDDHKQAGKLSWCAENNLRTDARIILYCGRLETQKDPKLLMDTFPLLAERDDALHLIVVGDGSMKTDILKWINTRHMEKKVFFLGPKPRDRVADLMRISDVFLLTSAFEGMPIAVLEAMACGLPVVSTEVGEIRRIVKNGVSGHVVGDRAPESLADAVMMIMKHPDAFTPKNIVSCVSPFFAETVLEPVYREHYRMAERYAGQH